MISQEVIPKIIDFGSSWINNLKKNTEISSKRKFYIIQLELRETITLHIKCLKCLIEIRLSIKSS